MELKNYSPEELATKLLEDDDFHMFIPGVVTHTLHISDFEYDQQAYPREAQEDAVADFRAAIERDSGMKFIAAKFYPEEANGWPELLIGGNSMQELQHFWEYEMRCTPDLFDEALDDDSEFYRIQLGATIKKFPGVHAIG